MNILEVNNLSFQYLNNSEKTISNLSFFIKNQEIVSVVGSSGCGKSTLIKILANIEKKQDGKINIKDIAYMPQKDTLFPWRTVLDNILLPIEIKKANLNDHKRKATLYLEKFGLSSYINKYPQDLSGGMRQRVSFIRTLLLNADLFLLDEPFSALDAITREDLQKWLLETLKDLKKSMLFITHDIDEAIFLSNRILVCTNKPLDNFLEFNIPDSLSLEEKLTLKLKIISLIKGENNEKN